MCTDVHKTISELKFLVLVHSGFEEVKMTRNKLPDVVKQDSFSLSALYIFMIKIYLQ